MQLEATHEHRERSFAPEELFFSCTDRKGFILTSNSVFVRISGYSAEELLGRPHNIIRHPDMPRVVFRTLWDHLDAGKGLAAYVKNRAKDGAFYWVLAAVRPIPGGHLSVRMKPASPYFALIPAIYAELRSIEQDIEDAGGSRTEAMDASGARLGEILVAHGFDDYTSFIDHALITEVTARRALLSGTSDRALRSGPTSIAAHLDEELQRIDRHLSVNEKISHLCGELVEFSNQGSILSFNAQFASSRLGDRGRTLKAVADQMQEVYPGIVGSAASLVGLVATAREQLRDAAFRVALASLQNDMANSFCTEATTTGDSEEFRANRNLLFDCLREDVEVVEHTLDAMAAEIHAIEDDAVDLRARLDLLSAIERNGRIEAHSIDASAFVTLLDELRARVIGATTQATSIAQLLGSSQLHERTGRRAGGNALMSLLESSR